MSEQHGFDKNFKIILIGDSSVGKSSILNSLIYNSMLDGAHPTVGIDYTTKIVNVNGKTIKLSLWDTAGQERFKSLITVYYRGVDAVIMVYDITNRRTFENVDYWMSEVIKYCNENVVTMLIGNKRDLVERREITYEDANSFAKDHDLLFMETSALTLEGIDCAFVELATLINKNQSLRNPIGATTIIPVDRTADSECGCL